MAVLGKSNGKFLCRTTMDARIYYYFIILYYTSVPPLPLYPTVMQPNWEWVGQQGLGYNLVITYTFHKFTIISLCPRQIFIIIRDCYIIMLLMVIMMMFQRNFYHLAYFVVLQKTLSISLVYI